MSPSFLGSCNFFSESSDNLADATNPGLVGMLVLKATLDGSGKFGPAAEAIIEYDETLVSLGLKIGCVVDCIEWFCNGEFVVVDWGAGLGLLSS